jgi:multiple sugar transport system ATP-binding protein
MAQIQLQDVSKRYGSVTAVDRITLSVNDKEFVVLVGPSGCGKSTTLRMIAGLENLTEGEIYIGDRNVTHVPPKDRDIAMVFQNYALYPHMNVYKNMSFGSRSGFNQSIYPNATGRDIFVSYGPRYPMG